MANCPNCGKPVSGSDTFCSSCGQSLANVPAVTDTPAAPAQRPADAKKVGAGTASPLGRVIDRMPVLDDVLFWLIAVAALLLFAGITGLVFHDRPFWEAASAFPGFLVYAALAWKRYKRTPLLDLEFLIPLIVVVVDLLVTRGLFSYSAILISANLFLVYLVYRTRRDKTVGEQMSHRSSPRRRLPDLPERR